MGFTSSQWWARCAVMPPGGTIKEQKPLQGGVKMQVTWLLLVSCLPGRWTMLLIDQEVLRDFDVGLAVRDIMLGLPASTALLVYDNSFDDRFPAALSHLLHDGDVLTSIFSVDTPSHQAILFASLRAALDRHEDTTVLMFTTANLLGQLLEQMVSLDLVHRRLLCISVATDMTVSAERSRYRLVEAMRLVILTAPRSNSTYRVFYSQASAAGDSRLRLVNWWSPSAGLFRRPALPAAATVYRNFHGRNFLVPVLHKPPWNFVQYDSSGGSNVTAHGGRDDTLLAVIADRLNFQYEYFAPSDRTQGSAITANGTLQGILGLIWRREAGFCLGDVTVTWDRGRAVDFSFPTLADSGAFVTRAPGRLNEALALVRSFHWRVWPLVVLTMLVSGPVLFALIVAPACRRRSYITHSQRRTRAELLCDCVWFTATLFLRQNGREPASSVKARLFMALLSLAATYVIGDMYSANLTSMLARPGREAPIQNLEQLEAAVRGQGYQLLVERDGSSYSILKNGTSVYRRLWHLMGGQRQPLVSSLEQGMLRVRDEPRTALLGGRETLYFDTRRFGAFNFHLSEKLYTRYSAIALQIGCPYLENFNQILMQLFEAGILTKMTEEEYAKLGEYLRSMALSTEEAEGPAKAGDSETTEGEKQPGQMKKPKEAARGDDKLRPINVKMLQGAFFVLFTGYLISVFGLVLELLSNQNRCSCMACCNTERCGKLYTLAGKCLRHGKVWHSKYFSRSFSFPSLDYIE